MQIRIFESIPEGLSVIETMRMEDDGRIQLWGLHLARLRRDCSAVGFPLEEIKVEDALAQVPQGEVLRLRLAISSGGEVNVTHEPLPPNPPFWRVKFSGHRLKSHDPWLQIKTTYRPIYDLARADMPEDCDEVILQNERGEICEGSITNIFLCRNGVLLTPPLSCGLLPGVLRQSLLDQRKAREAVLSREDIQTGELFCGNALRGLLPVKLNERAMR